MSKTWLSLLYFWIIITMFTKGGMSIGNQMITISRKRMNGLKK